MNRLLALIFTMLCFAATAQSVNSFGVAFYDVDRLYDTHQSKFYDDSDYTPSGRLGWSEERYRRKVEQAAAVVDSMAMPVVALYGVENEQVVKDVAEACNGDYAYIHRTSASYDGLDFALLYYGDCFFPERVTQRRGILCVEGEAYGEPLTIVAAHRATSLGVVLDELKTRGDSNIIILGGVGKLNFKKWGLYDASRSVEKLGRGNVIYRGMWQLRDRVLTNIDSAAHCDVYIHRTLIDASGEPKPTFEGAKYCAGVSSFLPIFIYFDKIFAH